MTFLVWLVTLAIVMAVNVAAFEIQWRDRVEIDLAKGSLYECPMEGRFPHPQQCGNYVECIRNTKQGVFKKRFGNCHGAAFDSEKRLALRQMRSDPDGQECNRRLRTTRALPVDRRFSNICSEKPNGFFCADCKTLVNCVNGVAFTEACGASDTCSERSDFGGAVCYPSPQEKCTCVDANSFSVDAYDNHMFFFCSSANADPDIYHCPEDMEFDTEINQCKNRNGFPPCAETGVFAFHSNCSQYYTCVASQNGWLQKPLECASNTMYNEIEGACEDPCSWDTGKFTCQQDGRFPDPLSCGSYYQCIQLPDNSFRQEHRHCPDGYQWSKEALENKGSCVKGPVDSCKPLAVTKCTIPDRCSAGALRSGEPASAQTQVSFLRAPVVNANPIHYSFIEFPVGNVQNREWNVLNRGDRRSRVLTDSN
ncbi:uncharacterized protein [Macrobrachium rosenbergii]|uniref:uncharacterized protein n=1 Tax=Macrobrachium rosenbergii TaxID=79674 RepID=UPI0034D4BF8B